MRLLALILFHKNYEPTITVDRHIPRKCNAFKSCCFTGRFWLVAS